MEIKTIDAGTPYVFAVCGRLDTNTAPQLEEFAEGLHKEGVNNITVMMGECAFISSAGLRVVVAMQKHATGTGGVLVFKDVLPEVLDVFTMTGFDKLLTLE